LSKTPLFNVEISERSGEKLKGMTTHLPAELLLQVRQRIEAAVGLHFSQERLRELDRKIRLAARKLAFLDATAFAYWILSSPFADNQIRPLAGHLTEREAMPGDWA
jgi:hypothetical protein